MACTVMGIILGAVRFLAVDPVMELGIGVILGGAVFFAIAFILRMPEITSIVDIVRSALKLNKKETRITD